MFVGVQVAIEGEAVGWFVQWINVITAYMNVTTC